MKTEEIPSIESVKYGHVSIPDEIEERILFLCKVFEPARSFRLDSGRDEFKIAGDYFEERLEETRQRTEQSIRAGATARAAAQIARQLGLVSSDDEQAELTSDLLEPLREAGFFGPDKRGVEGSMDRYRQGQGHLSRVEGDYFDNLFFEFTNDAEVAAAGFKLKEQGAVLVS